MGSHEVARLGPPGAAWTASKRLPGRESIQDVVTDEHRLVEHQPLRPVAPPVSGDSGWRSPIDRFILTGLEAKGPAPAAATKRTLIRRATFDLIGLPPTPRRSTPSSRTAEPDASPVSWTGCSPHRPTASVGAGTGSMWCALMPIFRKDPKPLTTVDRLFRLVRVV